MTSPLRSFARDEASVTSPYRHPFAASPSPKPSHSPFLARRSLAGGNRTSIHPRSSNDTLSAPRPDLASRPPDAISTSSSTLVNADTTSDYRPWEVRSTSSDSSLASALLSVDGGATPTLSALDEVGTLPSIHISPLPARTRPRPKGSDRPADAASPRRSRPRQVCPDDCRCSDQDIDLALCRRAVASSSSGSDPGSLSVGMHPMRPRNTTSDAVIADAEEALNPGSAPTYDQSHNSNSASEPRSHSRDFEKDPVLVPKSARARLGPRTHQNSFDQLQRGLDTLESSDSADSDAEHSRAVQRRAESMARWTARRSSTEVRSQPNGRRSPVAAPVAADTPPPARPGPVPSPSRRTPQSRLAEGSIEASFATPLMTPGRKSIAAVFESMQKERESRAAEEHRQWQEKQARRERERAARAFVPSRRRTSATSSQFDSPASTSTVPERASPDWRTPATRSPVSVSATASPLLSSAGSPKIDEHAASDVQPRHLGEEASARIPDTLAEADEDEVSSANGQVQDADRSQEVSVGTRAVDKLPTTPQTQQAAFGFASQPMALDLSPARSLSSVSSPASSPRKGAHRRQNTNTVSVAANLPSASLGAARQRLNHVLRSNASAPDEQDSHLQAGQEYPQTPINSILSSARKGPLSAARRGHSVRFSPRPDYRSDSGSWDESTQAAGNDEGDSREAAVTRLLLPAQPIRIPDILQAASDAAPAEPNKEHVVAAAEAEESVGGLHTAATVDEPEAAGSFSQSVRFPGAYARTPVKAKTFSRHIIRASPKTERVLPPAMITTPAAVQGEYGLFPESGAHIPRESTPPPRPFLPPDDPRNSPRSPRPASLGQEFASFETGTSDDSGGSNAQDLRGGGGDESLQATVSKMLSTMQAAHEARGKRSRLGEAITAVGERVRRVEAVRQPEYNSPTARLPRDSRAALEATIKAEEQDRKRIEELRAEVAQALAVLADRIVRLQAQSPNHLATPPLTSAKPSRAKLRIVVVVVVQCMLMAYLMALAERKAHRMRMFAGPSDLRHVLNARSNIEWESSAHDIHLTPLLAIPGLAQLANAFPPLPSPSMLRLIPNHPATSVSQIYTAYIRINGFPTFALQLALYAIAQLIGSMVILLSAPIHVLWYIANPSSF
ncbi:hypothetical protein L1887_58243 [Cichorium endivia]|nr:hypothetical protein L1887_58243 [Cichorium endivia]